MTQPKSPSRPLSCPFHDVRRTLLRRWVPSIPPSQPSPPSLFSRMSSYIVCSETFYLMGSKVKSQEKSSLETTFVRLLVPLTKSRVMRKLLKVKATTTFLQTHQYSVAYRDYDKIEHFNIWCLNSL